MSKARFVDIAREAGVGTATVERVLNERGGVSPATVERVLIAAKRLGYNRILPRVHQGIIRIEVVMVRPETAFFTRLNKAFERISASLDPSILVQRTFLNEFDPLSYARHLTESGSRRSGLIVVAGEHPEIQRSLDYVRASGVDIVHIVSPTGRASDIYVGIDNHAAGRTAALYMSNMLRAESGKVLAVCHSWLYRVHRERIAGFSDFFTRHVGPIDFSEILFSRDEDLRATEVLSEALSREADIVGVYNAGGANAGVASALARARQMAGRPPILWIGHELTDETKGFLKSGLMTVALDQAPETQARRALDMIMKKLGIIDVEVSSDAVPFLTYTAENVA